MDPSATRRIIRVFPRRTRATPDDDLAVVNEPPGIFHEADEVQVSCTFTYDLPRAEWLQKQWRHVAQVRVGGPALDDAGGEFSPGMYLRHGYTITSRGCPNGCWFCDVPRREGGIRELPIRAGWNVLDSNLLACSDEHIRAVFAMLARQPHRPEFTGGLEAARLKPWHAEALRTLRPKSVFMAYDSPDDWEPLVCAARMLYGAGFTAASHVLRCYVLIGHPRDTIAAATERLQAAAQLGLSPMAMLYRDNRGETDQFWRRFQRQWARPAIIHTSQPRLSEA